MKCTLLGLSLLGVFSFEVGATECSKSVKKEKKSVLEDRPSLCRGNLHQGSMIAEVKHNKTEYKAYSDGRTTKITQTKSKSCSVVLNLPFVPLSPKLKISENKLALHFYQEISQIEIDKVSRVKQAFLYKHQGEQYFDAKNLSLGPDCY